MFLYIQSLSIIALEIICCKIFFEIFGEKRAGKKVWIDYGIIISLILFGYAAALLLNRNFFLKQVTIIAFTTIVMLLFLRISVLKSFILSALFQGLLLVADYMTLLLNVSIFHSISEIGKSHYFVGSMLVILGKVFLFLIILFIKKYMGNDSSVRLKDTEWMRFILFPVFTICSITAMLTTSGNIKSQEQEDMFLTIALCLAGMNIIVFYLINDIFNREAEICENKIYQLQIKNQTNRNLSVFENFDKQRKKTHEYKNQILCIQSLISKKKYQELEEYVQGIGGHLSKELDSINTNNVIVDAILNSKYQEILEKKIAFIFKINDLSEIKISDEDIVTILSNLLNNAIEACEKCHNRKAIKVKFVKEQDNIIISVKNTYEENIIVSNGQILTSKKYEWNEHGIGIKNIVETIDKYHGFYAIKNDHQEFYFSIVIPQ